jgi:dihydroorotate dehydrogenase electron transfer subunit
MNNRITLKIAEIKTEAPDVKTFTFRHKLQAKPGQFVMLTDFEHGEKPFSIADCRENQFSLTVKKVGFFTTHLLAKNVNDYLSIRGAFGSSFFISEQKVLLVGGGYGVPPLYFLTKELLKNGADVTVVNGARTKDDLLFCDYFRNLEVKYNRITQAGCFGDKGTSVDIASKLLAKEHFDFVYAAGPDLMLKALLPHLKGIQYEFLVERYMKCAIGICGQCTLDPLGIRVCVEGPVLKREMVEKITALGSYHRDASGKRIDF